jgi:hypothetical protein
MNIIRIKWGIDYIFYGLHLKASFIFYVGSITKIMQLIINLKALTTQSSLFRFLYVEIHVYEKH